MYEDFYHFSARPFRLTPDPKFYFESSAHSKAMAYLRFGIGQEEGFIVISGDVGTGKTMLVRHLMEDLEEDTHTVAVVSATRLDGDSLLRVVANAFGVSATSNDTKGDIQIKLENFFKERHFSGHRCLLIIDEAQNLSSEALEDLRVLSNFQHKEHALLQSFLIGQPEFRDLIFNDHKLEQLRQRVIASHHLETMTREDTEQYIAHRLTLVGWDGDPEFTEDAYDAIHQITGGLPRKLNALCNRLLLSGAIEAKHRIEGDAVRDVADEYLMETGGTAA